MQPSDPDVRLMLAYRGGDEAALAELYRRWAARLLRYLERIVKEPALAEELLQDTFVRVLDARERYAPEARFSTWLFHIARNLACNELARSRSRHPHVSADASESRQDGRPQLALVADGPRPDVHADARREHDRFARAFATLPERQQSALWLAVVEGHSYDEIASGLDCSVQSVKNLVHRARAALADRMQDAAPSPGEMPVEKSR
jgi:RNA polymerase sigma-70 factor, ECF subfamily